MLTPSRHNQYHSDHIGNDINNNNTAENITHRRNRANNNTTTTFNTDTDNSDNPPFLNNVSPTMSDLFSSPPPSQPLVTDPLFPNNVQSFFTRTCQHPAIPHHSTSFTDLPSTLTALISLQSSSLSTSMSLSLSPTLQLPCRPRDKEAATHPSPAPQFSKFTKFATVTSDDQELRVHQVILIARWAHFRNTYQSGMMETVQRQMQIDGAYHAVLALMKYLNGGQLDQDESWQEMCYQRLFERHLTIDSCIILFETVIMVDEDGLQSSTLDYVFAHYGMVSKTHLISSLIPQECIPDEAI
ncbi:hypothetical protein BC941DRAFT_474788 [Chlamydoabsidia padenii]|nr:hypothetical protein BC941DRAFT_474788 [Chlamydoabsidia padenii]